MREGSAPLIRREDYTAPAYTIRQAELCFDLDAAKTIVASKLSVQRDTAQDKQPLRLHGEDLNLLRVLVDGQSVSFRHEDGQLVIDAPEADAFTLEIRNTIAPEKNTQLSGLYASGSGLFTQCEAEGFRRITYFLDRPDVMATFTVTLRADKAKYPVLLSNGNLVEQGDLDGGRHFAVWNDPFPKPCYLFALVAADLVRREQRVTSRGGREHLLQIYVKRGDLEKTEHAMNSLIASIIWDEHRFGLPLDLERFMIVAVDDFNMGAMENKGLNIFNTKFVLASPATATDEDFDGIESVVGHEYFHNWTGNRITCRDWFQLSLKEGLTVFRDQEFSMDMSGSASARAVRRIADVCSLRERQFTEDAGAMAHPVRPDAYQAIDNFYTPTIYEKGAEVVRMMHTLVGRAGFAAGMKLYFQRHDGQAVTCDDFAQAIADANPGSTLATQLEVFKRWYSQAGTPRLQARGSWDAASATYTLTLRQHTPATPGQHDKQPQLLPVRMGLVGHDGQAVALQLQGEDSASGTERVLVLTEAEQVFVFTGVTQAVVPSLLRGFSAPVLLDDGLSDAELLVLLAHDADAFNRWEAGQRLAVQRLRAAVQDGGAVQIDDTHLAALRALLLDPDLDPSFKARALQLPVQTYLAELITPVDPQRIHAACESWQDQLAARLQADWATTFEAMQVREGYRPDAAQSGRRALANLALAMLVRQAVAAGDPVWPGRAFQRFKDATNMTDRLGALEALVNAHAELAQPALERFLALAGDDALVVDKWFQVQARAAEKDGRVFARVRQLLQHPQFTLSNPNRARSVLSSLVMFNPAAFHRSDAAGYVLWADMVIALDAANPQLASRIARALDRWTALAEPYRSAAREAIARVAASTRLSGDVREIVTRALDAA
ncbi:aminopeptidase N [Ideonella sp. 4Y16]|uniref:Aminopeptidase N n=1 Tax=Ideonella alba TaxID=2824118 RepID=A0A940Y7U9_9BURK|nr:aminopeptidase N [Ideonella alba]MBQ0931674.1 aminopeptidase N [Ideonella alba]MBQ0944108.1 aminopeptidase N [Ideonella alba]